MANIRTLKLNLLADTTDFAHGIKKASGQTESFSNNIVKNMKYAAGAAIAFGVAFGVSAVKAAAADQKSQKQLALALQNTTKATKGQVAEVEKYITKTQLAYGVSDSKLRPSLAKLVRVTGDVTKSQDLLNLALDISAGTGKDLETVTGALTRAQQGNLAGLKKLGIPLSDTIIKNKDLQAALDITKDKFKGAAKAGAETFSGKLAIFNETMGEAKETIGTAIITAIQPFAEKWMPLAATGVQHFIDGLLGQNNAGGLKGAIEDNQTSIYELGQKVSGFFTYLENNKQKLKDIAVIIGSIFIGAKAGAAVSAMVTALSVLRSAFVRTTAVAATTAAAEAAATGGASLLAALPAITAIAVAFGLPALIGMYSQNKNQPQIPKGVVKGAVTSGEQQQKHGVGAGARAGIGVADPNVQPRWSLPPGMDIYGNTTEDSSTGTTTGTSNRKNFMSSRRGNTTTIINLNGIVDAESARRSIETVLQSSSVRTQAVQVQGSLI